MKKFLVSMVAVLAATSAFAGDLASINLDIVQKKPVANKAQGPAFSAKSFAGEPVLNHKGQIVGFDAVVIVDKYDQNFAAVRPLAEYAVAGVKVRTVAAVSFDNRGKKAYGGLGVLVPVGKFADGVDLELGAIAPGAEFTNAFKISQKIAPAVKIKVQPTSAYRSVIALPSKAEKALRDFSKQVF